MDGQPAPDRTPVVVGVLRETTAGEARVAATPETVTKLARQGVRVLVEAGAGEAASIRDGNFEAAGAGIADRSTLASKADAILCVRAPDPASLDGARAGTLLVGMLAPAEQPDRIADYARRGLVAMAMEWLPRTTRAQAMDVLSSQANLGGYKAVLVAADAYGRAFPMMMTAAGTISAARVFVMGVGVAGLQAIATARRLGAQVSATDVRSATREQIQSLGAKPVFVETVAGISGEGAGGYATEMSPEYQAAQAELVSGHIARQDIVITTALIPGRTAPRLVSDAQIATMRPGSVIVDMAAASGGNVEGSMVGETRTIHGVHVIGVDQLAARLPADASALYARNLMTFIASLIDADTGRLTLAGDDEIVGAVRLTDGGQVVHERLGAAKNG